MHLQQTESFKNVHKFTPHLKPITTWHKGLATTYKQLHYNTRHNDTHRLYIRSFNYNR